ncbi:hypothetical protein [Mesorhizobium marinum]|uniref:Lipoprotein n=1 Tax=Mesorhizobium marinum TaxID=3228790 RepID=A0ABV3R2P2_9HYPH
MRRIAGLAALLVALAMPAGGCAYVTAQPVRPGEQTGGIRIYDVKPLLVVSGENVTVQMVPNYNRAYALRFGAFLAKNHFQAAMTNGVLTSVNANMDSTAFIDLLKVLAEKVPEGFSGRGQAATPGGIKDRFQVYDIVFDDAGNLVGLRPLLIEPHLLRVRTANAQGFGDTTTAPQPGVQGGVKPGPVQG